MSHLDTSTPCRTSVYVIAILGTFLIGYGLVRKMDADIRPPAVNANRTAERQKNLAELRAAATEQLESYGYVDKTRGVARLPVAKAIEMELQMGSPAVIRSNLLARVEKATAPLPKAPEKPSQFE